MTITRPLGWNRPTEQHYARCLAGPRAALVLADVAPIETVDLSYLVTILNQLNLGACVLHAVAQAIHAEMVRTGSPPTVAFLSRLMAYYLARCEANTVETDSGTEVCTALDAVAIFAGVGPLRESQSDVDTQPAGDL